MPHSLAQTWAIARCEFRIHWRRRGLKVMLLAHLVMQVFFFLWQYFQGSFILPGNPLNIPAADILTYNTGIVLLGSWPAAAVFLLVMYPFVAAEALPRDRQFGVRELLDSLPLPRPVYLAGKVLGVWLSVAAAVLPVMALSGVAWRIMVGPYRLGPFLAAMLLGTNVLILLNCGLTVLAAAGQPNALRALLVGLACVIVVPLLLQQAGTSSPLQLLNPLRPTILYYYMDNAVWPDIVWLGRTLRAAEAYALAAAAGLLELIVAGVLAFGAGRPGGER